MKGENIHKNLISLLKIFKNRPYHLSKYLLDNNAFSDDFIKKINNSDKLNSFSEQSLDIPKHFPSISQMEDFYNSLLEEVKEEDKSLKRSKKQLLSDLTEKLNKLISEEKYEEAAALRDFMTQNGIRKSK